MSKAFAVFMAAIAVSTGAWACSCMRSDRQAIIANSDAAFRARVLKVSRMGDENTGQVVATIRILRSYKGVRSGRVLRLATGANSAMCGIEFRKGDTISVGASKTGKRSYQTGLCAILPDPQ